MTSSLQSIGGTEQHVQLKHKEEAPGRINEDAVDREKLQQMLGKCIDQMDTDSHQGGQLLNIQTGQLAHPDVNVDKSSRYWQDADGTV